MSETELLNKHNEILEYLLKYRKEGSSFTFSPRKNHNNHKDDISKCRLCNGYWFQGANNYIFVALYNRGCKHNKTKTIGYVFAEKQYIEIVFKRVDGITQDEIKFYGELIEYLKNSNEIEKVEQRTNQYFAYFKSPNMIDNLNYFIKNFRLKSDELIKKYNLDDKFFVSIDEFNKRIDEINEIKNDKLNNQEKKQETRNKMPNNTKQSQPLNQILYGPPGTGKTYNTIDKALEIIDGVVPQIREEAKKRFDELQKAGQIEFVAFHQSYGYEEFVEGIKAKTSEKGIEYKIESGIFKKLSKQAKENYENSQKSLEKLIQEKSLQQKIEQFLNDSLEDQREFTKTKGGKFKIKDIRDTSMFVFTEDSNYSENILELDIGELFKILDSDIDFKTSRQLAKDVFGINNQRQKDTYYFSMYKEFQKQKFDVVEEEKVKEPLKNHILIIDEINRGNISKIFGELITLIEQSKRIGADEEIRVKLPYSGYEFGVPQNLYIIGTMNTADRSIALMDTALRRRFDFTEMMPKSELLDFEIDGINLKSLLETINKRVEYLYDRDHTIGHAYFMSLNEKSKLAELDNIFRNKIIPLLQEYFYDDWEKIRLVLNDGFISKSIQKSDIFDDIGDDYIEDEKYIYTIVKEFSNEAYLKLCKSK
ncbi:McrB family protein [Sulfurimonas sp.]|uniref:McrB family protein n=1 Tax=Sulfurimonas sp. TaxID=2022749 RepID=UPI00286E9589|nr:AAA family ATPase [Sulfurimonas sp.]